MQQSRGESMTLVGVNLGVARVVGNSVTGIYKSSTGKPTRVESLGLVGDVVSDRRHHGGADQAVYVYGDDDYEWWRMRESAVLAPGTFGDNLTIAGLSCRDIFIGDRFRIGNDVVIEATAPRIPCATLAARMQDKQFPARFKRAERPGFYCRVLNTGTVVAGDDVEYIEHEQSPRFSVVDMFRLHYQPNPSVELLLQVLEQPVAIRERKRLESILNRKEHMK
ncbi:MAG: MOSC domain-containing protein [Gammaproteobacteria bacterium]|nr:MOSC domain-containing protein [Gammaproteobacteria bacterium]MYD79752.1 MOSC domain-containing protein [Gammaproteobacteria bacterium]